MDTNRVLLQLVNDDLLRRHALSARPDAPVQPVRHRRRARGRWDATRWWLRYLAGPKWAAW
jgi:hypothetical protein